MKWLLRIAAGFAVLVALGIAALFASGNGALLRLGYGFVFGAPGDPFDPALAAPAPDYEDAASWAALPSTADLADLVPAGVEPRDPAERAPVDVFFIHPTGYLNGTSWTSPMDPGSVTEENTQWMLANQASAYSGCCEVYAPRYREATIFAYFSAGPEEKYRVMRFAYQDVERAFDHFLEQYNQGRPFILASHSQGTHHGVVLLRERIDGTPLAERMVAAYLIGGGLAGSEFAGMTHIGICNDPKELGCAVHWDTMSEEAPAEPGRAGNVCVNPLTWKKDGGPAPKSAHRGAVPVSGRFQVELIGDEAATGVAFPPLAEPIPSYVGARCADGVLRVDHQEEGGPLAPGLGLPGSTNYHGLDYPLFHMDIRENAMLRARSHLAARAR